MFVKYLGHSAFYLKGKEFSVVTDPFSDIGYVVERVDCDYALSSHAHFDHNYFDGVNARKNVTECYGPFTAIPCWHDEVCGGKRGANNAFFFEFYDNILKKGSKCTAPASRYTFLFSPSCLRNPEINGITVAVEAVNAHYNTDCKINAKVRRTARTDERKSNTDTRQKHKVHADVDNNLRANHKRRSETEQTARKVA